jgi:hypothetical protein
MSRRRPDPAPELASAEAPDLLFGLALRDAIETADAPVPSSAPRPETLGFLERRAIPYRGGYRLRGRWLSPQYTLLRNASWAVRNSRVGSDFNPLALKLVLVEAQRLMDSGEQLVDILEAFAELLSKP